MGLLEKIVRKIRPGSGRINRAALADRVSEHFGKQYLKNTVSHNDFQEQESLNSPDGSLNNHLNRLDYNKLYFEGSWEASPVIPNNAGGAGPTSNETILRDIITSINEDHEKFKSHFLDKNSDFNRVNYLEEGITKIAGAKPDKEGYFSIPEMHDREQVGRSPTYRFTKKNLIEEKINEWVEDLHQNRNLDYLKKDHLSRSFNGGRVTGVAEEKLDFNDDRKEEFRKELLRDLMPKSVVKEYSKGLKDTLHDLEKCITGAGRGDGFTKSKAKEILSAVKGAYENGMDPEEALTSMSDFENLDRYFRGMESSQKGLSVVVGMKPLITPATSTGRADERRESGSLIDWARAYCEISDELENHKEFYSGKQGKPESVKERISEFNKTAINPESAPSKVKDEYDFNSNAALHTGYSAAIAEKYTSRARKRVQKEKEKMFNTIITMLNPQDERHKDKTPHERMNAVIKEFYQPDASEGLRGDVKRYVALTKLAESVDAADKYSRMDSMMCRLQDMFSRRSHRKDACPELYKE
ncbi:MAG: hypothetical protein R6U32_03660 [Candidatus Woesearchaeota archaeon]